MANTLTRRARSAAREMVVRYDTRRLYEDAWLAGYRTCQSDQQRAETTSPRVASAAAKILRSPGASKNLKSVAASALTQAAGKKKRKG